MHQKMINFLNTNFRNKSVKNDDKNLISNFLCKQNILLLLEEILNNDKLLSTISKRSYIHALGFDKIVIADLSQDISLDSPKAQIRLHIWNPLNTNALPIVESMHEHSFNFVSTILTGHLENQQFTMNKQLTDNEERVLNDLKTWILSAHSDKVQLLNDYIEALEAKRLTFYYSKQFNEMYNSEIDYIELIKELTGFSKTDIVMSLISLQGHYVSNRITGEKKSYKHILHKYVTIHPYFVYNLNPGDTYFHPYELPHRLYYDNKELNSTILLTTPVKENASGGSLQRPTYIQNEEQNYNKISYTEEVFYENIKNYFQYLKKQ